MEYDNIEDHEEDLERYFINNDFNRIKQTTDRKCSIKFRLNVLNEALGGLLPGDFGIIGAYAEAGKTSFLVSVVSYMAQQLDEGCILWLNNEEPEDRIYRRLWEAVLETDWKNILRWQDKAEKRFDRLMGNERHRIRIYDIRSLPLYKIKKLIEKHKPKLVVIDLADKVVFTGTVDGSDHQRLTSLYKELRALSQDICPILALSHTDATVRWRDKSSNN